MVTGDHIKTATTIARQVEITGADETEHAVMAAADFDSMTQDELDRLRELPKVRR
jgi:P-type Na+/K+ transporter